MPGRAAERRKNPRYPVADATSGNRFGRGYIYASGETRGGNGSKETIYRLRRQEEAFGDLALSDLAEDDSLWTR